MSKLCPNCGANSPNNAKHCIDCGSSLENVTPNTDDENSSTSSSFPMKSMIILAIIVIIIAVISFNIFTSPSTPENVTITLTDVECWDGSSNNQVSYFYSVNGYVNNIPGDGNKYIIKTLFCDSEGKELASSTDKLSNFKANAQYDSLLGYYTTKNYIDVDHVVVQIVKEGNVINEFNKTMNTNKLTHEPTSNITV